MKKNWIIIFMIIFMLLFSSCSKLTGGNAPTSSGVEEIDTTGNGLEVKFDITSKWISNRRIDYELTLKNSGVEPIKLSRENFFLKTDKRLNNGDQIPFTQESQDSFYEQIFKNGEIILSHDQEISGIRGFFEVDETFFKENSKLEVGLLVTYDYKTKFTNNVEIDLKKLNLNVLDTLSQAAPVKVTKIELKPSNDLKSYEIGYYIEDKGVSTFADGRNVEFNNFNLKFGENDLNSNCHVWKKNKESKYSDMGIMSSENLNLDEKNNILIIACIKDFSIYNQEKFTTVTSGSFDYKYKVELKKSVSFPDNKNSNSQW